MKRSGAALALCLAMMVAAWLVDRASAQAPPSEVFADADQPYIGALSRPVTYEVDFSAVVTPPVHCKLLRVWMPVPPSDRLQQVTDSTFSTFPMAAKPKVGVEPVYGNKFAFFEFDHPQGAQIIRHRFRVTTHEVHWGVDPAKVTAVNDWPAGFQPYRRQVAPVASTQPFRDVLKDVQGGPNSSAVTSLFGAMDWIDRHLTYDHEHASLCADAGFAFANLRGHCSDYHGLCQTMGRSLGYPTRVTYGINLFPRNSPSHCKLEAYLPPYGWVSFDISETQKMIAAIGADARLTDAQKKVLAEAARVRLKNGFRDSTWMLWTRGTHYDLAPPAASGPVHVVRTIWAEADGKALPDPDPANSRQREYGWMTVHAYKADHAVRYPFKDVSTLTPQR